jgi:NAD(P)-dependent dehydrogenase (short-subunit alcohol dehydrogenase family)
LPSTLVTGANRGIGYEFARQYARDGWQVYAACRNPSDAPELHKLAADGNLQIQVIQLDVTKAQSIQSAAAEVEGQPVDILINNAGVGGAKGQTIGNIDYEAWCEVLNVNTLGPLRVTEAFVENVALSDRKLIATITSGMGSIGDNTSGRSIPYRSSKAAVNMVMRSVAIDLAPRGITCVVVNPGWVKSDMGGPHAKITPSESVTMMRRLFDELEPSLSGRFFNYDGRDYSW